MRKRATIYTRERRASCYILSCARFLLYKLVAEPMAQVVAAASLSLSLLADASSLSLSAADLASSLLWYRYPGVHFMPSLVYGEEVVGAATVAAVVVLALGRRPRGESSQRAQ